MSNFKEKLKEIKENLKFSFIVIGCLFVGIAIYNRFFATTDEEQMKDDLVGEYYWDPGLGFEIKVNLDKDGSWKKDVYENGVLAKPLFPADFSGKYQVIGKVIKKAEESYGVRIVSFDAGKSGYLFDGSCFKGLTDDILFQTDIKTAEVPFPGINEGGGRSYCKK
jgi:hypothetical protein